MNTAGYTTLPARLVAYDAAAAAMNEKIIRFEEAVLKGLNPPLTPAK